MSASRIGCRSIAFEDTSAPRFWVRCAADQSTPDTSPCATTGLLMEFADCISRNEALLPLPKFIDSGCPLSSSTNSFPRLSRGIPGAIFPVIPPPLCRLEFPIDDCRWPKGLMSSGSVGASAVTLLCNGTESESAIRARSDGWPAHGQSGVRRPGGLLREVVRRSAVQQLGQCQAGSKQIFKGSFEERQSSIMTWVSSVEGGQAKALTADVSLVVSGAQ